MGSRSIVREDEFINGNRDTLWLTLTLGGLALFAASLRITIKDHIFDTLLVTVYLMMIVGTKSIFLPYIRSLWMTATGSTMSSVTDSFVIVLAFKKMIVRDHQTTRRELDFLNLAQIGALSFGAIFFIGELYGLAFYIHHGLDKVLQSGLPMGLSLVPLLVALIITTRALADFTPEAFKKFDLRNTLELIFFVGLLIFTHDVLLSAGLFLLYEANFWGANGPKYVVNNLVEELRHGGFMALGLIIAALAIRPTPLGSMIENSDGLMITFWAMLSSPLTGALLVAHDLGDFYEKLGYLIGGAFLAPWSSLVGVMVLRPHQYLRYFLFSIPFSAGFLLLHWVLVKIDAYVWVAHQLGVTALAAH